MDHAQTATAIYQPALLTIVPPCKSPHDPHVSSDQSDQINPVEADVELDLEAAFAALDAALDAELEPTEEEQAAESLEARNHKIAHCGQNWGFYTDVYSGRMIRKPYYCNHWRDEPGSPGCKGCKQRRAAELFDDVQAAL